MVVICGHGSQSTNNPYASGLDCGACGGHAGDTNARLAANLLNDSKIREGLTKRGISIPSDTLFIAGLHNTTTDEVNLYDSDLPSSSDSSQLEGIREALAKSGDLSLLERRATLGVESGDHCQNHIRARIRDWSQLRPEWGWRGTRHSSSHLDLGLRPPI